MTRRKCWGQPVIYSCAEAEVYPQPRTRARTRFALDPTLTNEYDVLAGSERDAEPPELISPAGLRARPFRFRVGVHSDSGFGPSETLSQRGFWNSCQGKDGCSNIGNGCKAMTEEEMIHWLLEDA